MKCENTDCRKVTFVIHINRDYKKLCDECYKKNRKEVYPWALRNRFYFYLRNIKEEVIGCL